MLTGAFSTDPVFTYLLRHLSPTNRDVARGKIFKVLYPLADKNDAIFYEAHAGSTGALPQCAAIVALPGKKADDMGFLSVWGTLHFIRYGVLSLVRMLGVGRFLWMKNEYGGAIEPIKNNYFKSKGVKDYYELKYIGTDANHRGKGLAPALIRDVQATAAAEGKAVWLEASNRRARGVYSKCGFKPVGEPVVLGKGLVDSTGEDAVGEKATGVECFPMVWWP
jgi:ribosomal protein S18 acetylase RimI-like enzyme